jgi:hypothetical protein
MKDPRTDPLFKRSRIDERLYAIQCAILDVLLIAHADAIKRAETPEPERRRMRKDG